MLCCSRSCTEPVSVGRDLRANFVQFVRVQYYLEAQLDYYIDRKEVSRHEIIDQKPLLS